MQRKDEISKVPVSVGIVPRIEMKTIKTDLIYSFKKELKYVDHLQK